MKFNLSVVLALVVVALVSSVAGAVQELTFMHYLGAEDGLIMGELVEEFNKAHSEIRVHASFADPYIDKVLVASAAGAPPDVFLSTPENIPAFVVNKVAAPLDLSRFRRTRLEQEEYVPVAWRGSFVDGVMYGVSLGLGNIGLYISPALFQQAGLPIVPPATGEELEALIKVLNYDRDGDGVWDVVGLELPFNADLRHVWYSVFKQYGGEIFDERGDVAFGGEAGRNATLALTRLFVENDLVYDNPRYLFPQGRSAMRMNGTWNLHALRNQGVEYVTAPLPQFGPMPAAWAGSQYFLVAIKDENPERLDAVYTFVDWIAGKSLEWAIRSGHLPSRWDAIRTPEFFESEHHRGFVAQAEHLVFNPAHVNFPVVNPVLQPMINQAVRQVDSPLNLLDAAVSQARAAISR